MTPSVRALAVALSAALALTACGGDDGGDDGGDGGGDGGQDGGTLTVWTVEDLGERVQAQQAIIDAFTESTGTEVELVPIAEDQLTTVLTASAASGDLPDVIGALSLGGVSRLLTDDLLDTEAAAAVVDSLGEDTFSPAALELTRSGEEQLAVPSDSWAQLLFYRSDLFESAGLAPPDSYEAIEAAAAALDQGDVAGIVAATAPADSFTAQTFEHLALANGCQLVEGEEVALDSPHCAESFGFYADLIREHSVAGNQDADTTRAAYFAGRAGMLIWSSFLLDELAGLRNDALPTCPECAEDPAFLASNTGIVGAITGPSGTEPATFGEVVSWAILQDAATDDARAFVEYMMGEGYEQWLGIAPEGKVPTRTGTAEEPGSFVTAWQQLEAGVDTRAPLSEYYDPQILDTVATSVDSFTRWGFLDGQGELAGAVGGQFVVPAQLAELIGSGGDPAEAARAAAEEVRTIQEEIGG
jgi:multiple sugar transport system substrate-binding protein